MDNLVWNPGADAEQTSGFYRDDVLVDEQVDASLEHDEKLIAAGMKVGSFITPAGTLAVVADVYVR